ncbi:MAG: hypothetical protein QW620_02365 [Thermoplasmata archaeon]
MKIEVKVNLWFGVTRTHISIVVLVIETIWALVFLLAVLAVARYDRQKEGNIHMLDVITLLICGMLPLICGTIWGML